MRRLTVFNLMSVDGYFVDSKGDMSWAHASDPEFNAFVESNAKGGGLLVFGRITYELMASYWPTSAAATNDPVVAERMNSLPKLVFSRTLENAAWSNTRLVKTDPAEELRKLKSETGIDMVIMGSGSIVTALASAGLIDTYQMVVVPVVLGGGRTMFEGLDRRLRLKLGNSRSFGNGCVFLEYLPSA